jgi:hypothetical protein
MAAVSDTGVVLNIIICHDDEPETPNLITYTDNNPAYIGGTFDSGYFYPPQPYASWTRNQGTWIAPVPLPDSEGSYTWNEDNQQWEQIDSK